MKIREENRNMILLATVALVSAVVASGVSLLPPPSAPASGKKPIYLADQTSVRMVGPPFIPNTTSHQR
ncbi:hypothetical protein I6F35_28820 [Bradyrhizobium sp. BRP22]|uniref:hypothetical protein n=1 Tax=Bradyrhizobium sp. BRP22 TaxID=2793821 RepID=UPI001CD69396|nr:hypothetical protein [Bradyrhizobium sp. BRP22]MCA1457165.1 hypothetical protein [Bradyrhizobium sp. BRP22]